ncbi:MAG: ferrous iron transporter B [Syntrophomonadaceae bacterium]|nr:ferrous iron transporter B [Syntrophomonadaceae bacterium]
MNIAVIGNPNVGKSAVLNRITGSNWFVSNYSGTSVEITSSTLKIGGQVINIYDTPGIYSLNSNGEEANLAQGLFNEKEIDLILNIVDATNLERNLILSYELSEMGQPMLILLNQIDRARSMGIKIDCKQLAANLSSPVLAFSAATGEGLAELMQYLEKQVDNKGRRSVHYGRPDGYGDRTEEKAQIIILGQECKCSGNCHNCGLAIGDCVSPEDLRRAEKARQVARMVSGQMGARQKAWLEKIQGVVDRPILGTIILLFIAYLGFKLLLNFIQISEGPINSILEPINRIIEEFIMAVLPSGIVSTVLAKAVPEGLIIPFTIIMPAMLMVGLLMALLEDTGLLPRYSVALERAGSIFGVSGQAIIPLSLGFGCRTPAIVATRILPTEAQRFIIITLLSIVIPCSATLGILASVISAFQASLAVIVITMLTVLLVLAYTLSRIMPGESEFIYELPPLRIPLGTNIWNKIKIRFSGFFTEVLPLLLLMSIGIRTLMESGVLELFRGLEGFTRLVFGIPAEAFVAVLITVFQRYLAPIVLMNLPLNPREATIAISMIALSLPCLPMMVMTVREVGFKSLAKIIVLGLATSFSVGILLNIILPG